MAEMTFYRDQELIAPDGYCCKVLLCGGPNVVVWLCNANQLPREKRIRVYSKTEAFQEMP